MERSDNHPPGFAGLECCVPWGEEPDFGEAVGIGCGSEGLFATRDDDEVVAMVSCGVRDEAGAPQCGHVVALVDTEPPHSGHFVIISFVIRGCLLS